MKATLEFNLPDDQYDFTSATKGQNYRHALQEFDQHLRSTYKHGECPKLADAAYTFRETLNQMLAERGIDLFNDE